MTTPTFGARLTVRGTDDLRAEFARLKQSGEQTFKAVERSGSRVGDGIGKSMTAAAATTAVAARTMRGALNGVIGTVNLLGRGVGVVVGAFNQIARVASLAGLGIGAGFGGAAAGLRQYTLSVSRAVEANRNLALSTGVSIETLTKWQAATRIAGGNADSVGGALATLRDQIVNVAGETDPRKLSDLMKPFTQLGIDVRNANGSLKTADSLLAEVSVQLAKISDEQLRAKAANDLLGGSAAGLIPLLSRGERELEELLKKGAEYGTQVSAEQAQRTAELLERQRLLGEAMKGVGLTIADAFLPIFTNSSGRIEDFLSKNRDKIAEVIREFASEFAKFNSDLAKAFGSGSVDDISNDFLRTLAPAIRMVRDVGLDLIDVLRGRGLGTRVPWLTSLVEALTAASGVARAFGLSLLSAAGVAVDDLPTIAEVFDGIKLALESVRLGLEGSSDEAPFPWLGTVGAGLGQLSRAIGNFVGILYDNREALAAFGLIGLTAIADGIEAIRNIFAGTPIDGSNLFAFLDLIIPDVRKGFDTIVADIKKAFAAIGVESVEDGIVGAFNAIVEAAKVAYAGVKGVIDGVSEAVGKIIALLDVTAKTLGLGDWKSLAVLLVIGKITGLLPALTSFFFILSSLTNLIFTWGGLAIKIALLGKKFLVFIGVGKLLAAAFGAIKVALVALGLGVAAPFIAIGAALVAAVALVYFFWDEIVLGAKMAWDAIVAVWEFVAEFFAGLFAATGRAVGSAWDAIVASAVAAFDGVVAAWDGLIAFFADLWQDFKDLAGEAWDFIAGLPGQAWDATGEAWCAAPARFAGLVDKVKGYFKGLWDGVKNGAADAWSSVKGFFGFGGGDTGSGTLDSFDVGGVVPGPRGQPRLATVHGGEKIFNDEQWGALSSILNGLLGMVQAPETAFAAGPVAMPAQRAREPNPLSLGIDGRRFGGFYADGPDTVRSVRTAINKSRSTGTGVGPRWRGGYA